MDKRDAYKRDLNIYLTGFTLAIGLTAASFWLALGAGFGAGSTLIAVGLLGLIQMIVHLRFFLHIDGSKQKHDDLGLFLFTTLVVLIIVLGTVWILGNLHERMHMTMGGLYSQTPLF